MNQHGNWVCWMSTGRCCERFNVKKTWHADHAATLLFDFRQLLLLDYFQPSRSHALSPTRDPTRARDCCPYGGDERNTLIRYAHNEVTGMTVRWVRKSKALTFSVYLSREGGRAQLRDPRTSWKVMWELPQDTLHNAFEQLKKPFLTKDLEDLVRTFPPPLEAGSWISQKPWLMALIQDPT